MTKRRYARLDADRTAKPMTRIVSHVRPNDCFGPGVPLNRPEWEGEDGSRIRLDIPHTKVKVREDGTRLWLQFPSMELASEYIDRRGGSYTVKKLS